MNSCEKQVTTTPGTWKGVAIFAIVLLVSSAVGGAIFWKNSATDEGVQPYSGNLTFDRAVRSFPAIREHSNSWCDGDETICTSLITTSPADSLQSLISAIPKGEAKHYKIRLSVVPIEDFEEQEEVHVERSAAPELIAPPSTN